MRLFALFVLVGASTAQAEVFTLTAGGDFETAVAQLGPGDELIVRGGTYVLTGRTDIDVHGTEAAPILIRAADGEVPHLVQPTDQQNIVEIDADWLTIRGLEFSGGSAGLRMARAFELTIDSCHIHDTGDVAIRANDGGSRYERLRILRNHIHDTNYTGEGMYLGCNSNGCQVADSVIEGNYVHHTNGASVTQGDGIEIKEGSYNNIVRDNVIHDTNYPCILVYSTVGNAPNVIERNVMWRCGDHGIQAARDATIRNNIILSALSDGIGMQPHQSGSPANLVVVHNTIFDADGYAISLRNATGSVVIANNALFAGTSTALYVAGSTASLVVAGNRAGGTVSGWSGGGIDTAGALSDFVDADYGGAPPIDVFPAVSSPLAAAGSPAYVVADDFNRTPRGGVADIGAYRADAAGNPGWRLAPAFKAVATDRVAPAAPANLRVQ